MNYLNEELRT